MPLLLLVFVLRIPDVDRLGAEDWRLREREERRCDNPLSALLLPPSHPNPEIDFRAKQLRQRNLTYFDPRAGERRIHAHDYEAWLYRHVVHGESLNYSPEEVFEELHSDFGRAALYMQLTGPEPNGYCHHDGVPAWLRAGVMPGEYEQFLRHRDYHRCRAPLPRPAPVR